MNKKMNVEDAIMYLRVLWAASFMTMPNSKKKKTNQDLLQEKMFESIHFAIQYMKKNEEKAKAKSLAKKSSKKKTIRR